MAWNLDNVNDLAVSAVGPACATVARFAAGRSRQCRNLWLVPGNGVGAAGPYQEPVLLVTNRHNMQLTQFSTSVPSSAICRNRM